jgi:GNAT superfamily N-acetyltransferase
VTLVELRPNELARALPLYRAAAECFPLVSAVLQNLQRGQVLADRRDDPRSAAVITHFGFTFVMGMGGQAFDDDLGAVLATEEMLEPSYLLWYSPPLAWRARLDAELEGVRRRERARLDFSVERAAWLDDLPSTPDGFDVRPLSADLVAATDELGLDIASRFWSSAADYEGNGFGACVLDGERVAAVCYAAAVVDGLAEVDVATRPEMRGRGLAFTAGQAFVRECITRSVAPTWDCFLDNAGSMQLAAKLGFVPVQTYPLYTFRTPIASLGAAM